MADLGRKHLCFKCAAKFYDLKKPQVICPKCGADQADAPAVASPPPSPPPPPRRPRVVDPQPDPELEEAEEEAEAAPDDDADLDLEGADEEAGVVEELDEPKGEDSYD